MEKFIRLILIFISYLPLYILSIPIVLVIHLIRNYYLIRFQEILCSRIGHLAANVDIYLCEKKHNINTPKQKYIDIFFKDRDLIANKYLFNIWKNKILILPRFIIYPIFRINKFFPNYKLHEVGDNSQNDRDIHNLLDLSRPNLSLTENEKKKGNIFLEKCGLSENSKFVCLIVRDSAYLPNLAYHNYRDGEINKYLLAADELTKLGYFVFRMGVKAKSLFLTKNKMIIDYATKGLRTEFNDIFLAANCEFCISTSTGFDAIASLFRKPIGFVTVPVGYIYTFGQNYVSITKKHIDKNSRKKLGLKEIFDRGCGFSLDSNTYENNNVDLIHNSEEEILDLAFEMHLRSINKFKYSTMDRENQLKFWKIFSSYSNEFYSGDNLLHGRIKSKICNEFLKKNVYLLN